MLNPQQQCSCSVSMTQIRGSRSEPVYACIFANRIVCDPTANQAAVWDQLTVERKHGGTSDLEQCRRRSLIHWLRILSNEGQTNTITVHVTLLLSEHRHQLGVGATIFVCHDVWPNPMPPPSFRLPLLPRLCRLNLHVLARKDEMLNDNK